MQTETIPSISYCDHFLFGQNNQLLTLIALQRKGGIFSGERKHCTDPCFLCAVSDTIKYYDTCKKDMKNMDNQEEKNENNRRSRYQSYKPKYLTQLWLIY